MESSVHCVIDLLASLDGIPCILAIIHFVHYLFDCLK
jgi:hypothetical protein